MSVKWNAGTDLAAILENVQTLTGQRGDGLGKAVIAEELLSLDLATKKTSSSGKTTLSPPTSFPGAPSTVVKYPSKPTGFTVESAFSFVVLVWDMPKYAGHSLTEIYRNAEDNLANAVLVGTEAAGVYSDAQNTGQTGYYYWIRHVNANGVPGPYNATAGTYGQTDPNAAQNLIADRVVAGIEIVTPLIRSARIQNGRFTVDENGNVVAINAVLNQVTANAGNFYDIIITRATIQNALITEDCTVLGSMYAQNIIGDIFNAQSGGVTATGVSTGTAGDYVLLNIAGENFDRILDSTASITVTSNQRQFFNIIVRTPGQADQTIFHYDTGNEGANGPATLTLAGITIPGGGRDNGNNQIIVNAQENRSSSASLAVGSPATFQMYKKGRTLVWNA